MPLDLDSNAVAIWIASGVRNPYMARSLAAAVEISVVKGMISRFGKLERMRTTFSADLYFLFLYAGTSSSVKTRVEILAEIAPVSILVNTFFAV